MGSKGDSLVNTDFALGMMSREQLEEFYSEASEDTYLKIKERPFRLTDEQVKEIIKKITKCKNAFEFQLLEVKVRNSCIMKLKKGGLSIRQISKLTGVSKGIVERCGKQDTEPSPVFGRAFDWRFGYAQKIY